MSNEPTKPRNAGEWLDILSVMSLHPPRSRAALAALEAKCS